MNRKIMNVDAAEDEVEVDDVENHEVKEEEDDNVENDDAVTTRGYSKNLFKYYQPKKQ